MNKHSRSSDHVHRYRWRQLWLPLAVMVLACVILWIGVTPEKLQGWIQDLGLDPNEMWARVAFYLLALVLISIVLPKTVVSISSGALFGTTVGCVMITTISVTAAVINYFIARWWMTPKEGNGRGLIGESPDSKPWQVAIRSLASKAGYRLHLLIRFAPIPSMIINYTMGALRARLGPFLMASFFGVIPQFLWVHGGAMATAGESEDGWRWVSGGVSVASAIAIAIVVPRIVIAELQQQSASGSGHPPSVEQNQPQE